MASVPIAVDVDAAGGLEKGLELLKAIAHHGEVAVEAVLPGVLVGELLDPTFRRGGEAFLAFLVA
jgi:hypothetical protein